MKRILKFLVGLALGFVGFTTLADPVAKIGETAYGSLQAAIDAAADGDTVLISQSAQETIAGPILISNKKNLTIESESWYNLTVEGGDGYGFKIVDSSVTFLKGYYYSTQGFLIDNSSVDFDFTGSAAYGVYGTAGSALTIVNNSSVTTENGTIRATTAGYPVISIRGDKADGTGADGIPSSLTIGSATVVQQTASGSNLKSCAIAGVKDDADGTTILLQNGQEISSASAVAVYQPQKGTLEIASANISGKTAVYAKSGTLIIRGGSLAGTGAKADYEYDDADAKPTGDALVLEAAGYPGGKPTVLQCKAALASKNADAFGNYAKAGQTAFSGKFICGGQLGGSAAHNPTEFLAQYVKDGYTLRENVAALGYYQVVAPGKIKYTNSTAAGLTCDTLEEAIADGAKEIHLMEDVTSETDIVLDLINYKKYVAIYLDGFQLTAPNVCIKNAYNSTSKFDSSVDGSVVNANLVLDSTDRTTTHGQFKIGDSGKPITINGNVTACNAGVFPYRCVINGNLSAYKTAESSLKDTITFGSYATIEGNVDLDSSISSKSYLTINSSASGTIKGDLTIRGKYFTNGGTGFSFASASTLKVLGHLNVSGGAVPSIAGGTYAHRFPADYLTLNGGSNNFCLEYSATEKVYKVKKLSAMTGVVFIDGVANSSKHIAYPTLQDALSEAQDGDRFRLGADNAESVVAKAMPHVFAVLTDGHTQTGTISAPEGFTLESSAIEGGTLYFVNNGETKLVAQVGDMKYTSFEGAVAAANGREIIVLDASATVPEGWKIADGKLVEKVYVAQVGDMKYETFEEAIAIADGQPIIVLVNKNIPEGWKVVYNRLVENGPVAMIGDESFDTLQEAFDAADGETTIVLINDTDELVGLENGKNVILDLNGHIIYNATYYCVIQNEGVLAVKDSAGTGLILSDKTGSYNGLFWNGGTLTIESGNFAGVRSVMGFANSRSYCKGGFHRSSTCLVDTEDNSAVVEITGGHFDNSAYLSYFIPEGYELQSDGASPYKYYVHEIVFYQDKADKNLWHVKNLAGLEEFRNEVEVKGTSFAGKTIRLEDDIGEETVRLPAGVTLDVNGKITEEAAESQVLSGDDGLIVHTAGTSLYVCTQVAAKVGDTKYATLADALAAAAASETEKTVVLQAETAAPIVVPANVIIDTNGKYTGDKTTGITTAEGYVLAWNGNVATSARIQIVTEAKTPEAVAAAAKVVDGSGNEVNKASLTPAQQEKIAQLAGEVAAAQVSTVSVITFAKTEIDKSVMDAPTSPDAKPTVKPNVVDGLKAKAREQGLSPEAVEAQIKPDSDVNSYIAVDITTPEMKLENEDVALKAMTYDVKPMVEKVVVTQDDAGNDVSTVVTQQLANSEIVRPLTFRMPLTSEFVGQNIKVTHSKNAEGTQPVEGSWRTRVYPVKGTGTDVYVEVQSDKFSFFKNEMTTEDLTQAEVSTGGVWTAVASLAEAASVALEATHSGETGVIIRLVADQTDGCTLPLNVTLQTNGHTIGKVTAADGFTLTLDENGVYRCIYATDLITQIGSNGTVAAVLDGDGRVSGLRVTLTTNIVQQLVVNETVPVTFNIGEYSIMGPDGTDYTAENRDGGSAILVAEGVPENVTIAIVGTGAIGGGDAYAGSGAAKGGLAVGWGSNLGEPPAGKVNFDNFYGTRPTSMDGLAYTLDRVRPRYPWNGKVDIAYTLVNRGLDSAAGFEAMIEFVGANESYMVPLEGATFNQGANRVVCDTTGFVPKGLQWKNVTCKLHIRKRAQ